MRVGGQTAKRIGHVGNPGRRHEGLMLVGAIVASCASESRGRRLTIRKNSRRRSRAPNRQPQGVCLPAGAGIGQGTLTDRQVGPAVEVMGSVSEAERI